MSSDSWPRTPIMLMPRLATLSISNSTTWFGVRPASTTVPPRRTRSTVACCAATLPVTSTTTSAISAPRMFFTCSSSGARSEKIVWVAPSSRATVRRLSIGFQARDDDRRRARHRRGEHAAEALLARAENNH